MNNKKYIVVFNKKTIHANTYEDAKFCALGLIERTCPHVATIIEIDEEGYKTTIAQFDASHAEA